MRDSDATVTKGKDAAAHAVAAAYVPSMVLRLAVATVVLHNMRPT